MNIVEKLDEFNDLTCELKAFRSWILDRKFTFGLIDIRKEWGDQDRNIVLKVTQPCDESTCASLVFTDPKSEFSAQCVLEEKTTLQLMSGREIDFSNIDVVSLTLEKSNLA